jgi:transcription initiation factor TFIIH subunit 4
MPSAISLDESTPHTLLPFLHSQSQSTLTRLYQRPSSCLSIFRSVIFLCNFYTPSRLIARDRLLAPLERQIVMNLLWLESAIPTTTMTAWVIRESKKYTNSSRIFRTSLIYTNRIYDNALATLSRLHILSNSAVKLALNATFKTSFRQALTGG